MFSMSTDKGFRSRTIGLQLIALTFQVLSLDLSSVTILDTLMTHQRPIADNLNLLSRGVGGNDGV